MAKKKKKPNIKSFLIPKLRSASLLWYARNEVLQRIRVSRGNYQCESCGSIFKSKDIHVDHIEPVISIEDGFNGWDTYIDRLFCDPDGLQGICKICHDVKTETEKALRASFKEKRKKESEVE